MSSPSSPVASRTPTGTDLPSHLRTSSSSSSSSSEELTDSLSPINASQPGIVTVEVNGRKRNSIIEYVQREDDSDPLSSPAAASQAEGGWESDEEGDERGGEEKGGVDPFYRELEKAEAERQRVREEKVAEFENKREEPDSDEPHPPSSSPSQTRPSLLTPSSNPSTSPSPLPSRNSRSSLSVTPSPSRRPSRLPSPQPLPPPSRSSLSSNKPRTKSLVPTPKTEVGLRPLLLIDGGGRRRLERQLLEVKRSVDEVGRSLIEKLEREKEREREKQQREQREQTQRDMLLTPATPQLTIREEKEEEVVSEEEKQLVVRESKEGPFAALLANLSFSNTLLPLTPEELALPSLPTTPSPTSLVISHGRPTSPPPLHYESCFPDWLSSRSDFRSFISQTQLLCLHVAEKPVEKRTGKDLVKLSAFLIGFPFFSRFTPHTLSELSRTCWLERRKKGERVDSKQEDGSVMRFLYEGKVSYETSIARLFKRKRQEREREEEAKKEQAKAMPSRKTTANANKSFRSPVNKRSTHDRTPSGLSAPPSGPGRARSATGLVAPSMGLSVSTSVPPSAQGVRGRSGSGVSTTEPTPRTRSSTLPPPSSASSTFSRSTPGTAQSVGPNQILSNALTFDPADHSQLPPSDPFSDSLDDLLLSHPLPLHSTFGQSLLFNHFFSSYSFSQIFLLKQQQRLHTLLGRNLSPPWGTVRLLVRSLMEQKNALHIHSVDVQSDECIFLCWHHRDLDAIAAEGKRFDTGEMVGNLRNLPFFAGWPFSVVQETAARAEVRQWRSGEVIVKEGEATNTVLFIVKGRVQVWKHCSVERAERWPAGAKEWEVTRTQRVKRYLIGGMGEGDVVGVEGICGVSVRDFEVRGVGDVTCYVVKRIAFSQWGGMKKVIRECQQRMSEWRDKAMHEIEVQARGGPERRPFWTRHTAPLPLPPPPPPPPPPRPPPREEEKQQMSLTAEEVKPAVLPPLLKIHRQGGAESVKERRKRLKAEEAERARKGVQRTEEYWMDRVMTVERMQEEKAKRRGKGKVRERQREEGETLGELPLMTEVKEQMEVWEKEESGGGGAMLRVRREKQPIDLNQTQAVISRSVDSYRDAPTMQQLVHVYFG